MKTAVFEDVGKVKIRDIGKLIPKPNQVLLQVDACAICTWEQRVYKGIKEVEFPFVGGHELSGTIVEMGSEIDTRTWSVGDTVVYGTNLACGECSYCKSNNEQNCPYFNHSKDIPGFGLHGMGGFSEYLLVETKHLFKYSKITPEEAALTEPLSCVLHSTDSANIEFGEYVLVIGCGIMGQLHIQTAIKRGAVVIASDLVDDRLEQASEFGAHYTINSSKEDIVQFIHDKTDGLGVDVIFNTTPISKVAEESIQLLGIKGRMVLYSSFYPDTPVSFSADSLHKKAQQLVGTANSNSYDFVRATALLSEGIINVKPLIDEVYPFEDVAKAIDIASNQDNYRVVLKMT